jgi:transketolase
MAYTPEVAQKLAEETNVVRRNIFIIFQSSNMGHAGGTMSLIEIVTALYFHHLKLDPKNCDWQGRDRVVLSKAHAAEAIYAVLAEIGFVKEDMLDKYYCYRSQFQGHADRWCTPGIDYSGGSLGQGLSFSAGLAMAEKIKTAMNPPTLPLGPANYPRLVMKYNPAFRVFCILGDGECHEGNIWEAAMFAGKYKLDNLVTIVDYNKFSIDGPTEQIMPLAPLDEKFKSFGWWVKEIDGHNMREIVDTLELANNLYGDGKPKCIIAHTVKGHGIPSWEDARVHYGRADAMSVGLKEGGKLYGKV